jgi:hypothetical protein
MPKVFSLFIIAFTIFSLVFSFENVEATAPILSKNDKKFITDFRSLDFLKICPENGKCVTKNIQWLRL